MKVNIPKKAVYKIRSWYKICDGDHEFKRIQRSRITENLKYTLDCFLKNENTKILKQDKNTIWFVCSGYFKPYPRFQKAYYKVWWTPYES